MDNVNFSLQTSGVVLNDQNEITPSYVKSNFLFGGSLGLGIDLGFTHQLKKQWVVTGSILDLGFIYNTKNVESYNVKGNFQVEGLQLVFDPNNPQKYWEEIKSDFDEDIILDTINSNYISFRPVKLNGAISYSFGRSYDYCRFLIDADSYLNKVGFQMFSTFGAVHSYIAGTFFYERKLSKKVSTKLTYTIDPFSFANLGAGLSMQLGPVNTYLAVDNLLNLSNLYDSKSASIQLGFNIIVHHKN